MQAACFVGNKSLKKAASHTCACWRMRERAGATESAHGDGTPQHLYKDFPSFVGSLQPVAERLCVPDRMNTVPAGMGTHTSRQRAGAPW